MWVRPGLGHESRGGRGGPILWKLAMKTLMVTYLLGKKLECVTEIEQEPYVDVEGS